MVKIVAFKAKNRYIFAEEFKLEIPAFGDIQFGYSEISREDAIGVAIDAEDEVVLGLFPPSMRARYEKETIEGYESQGLDPGGVIFMELKNVSEENLILLNDDENVKRLKAISRITKAK